MAAAADYDKKAQEAMKEGKKHASVSLLKWKPDYEKAIAKYNDAVKFYRLAGEPYVFKYAEALKEAANIYEKMESFHSAAKSYETAGTALEKYGLSEAKTVAESFELASRLYRMNQHPDKAATCLMKAGKAIGETDLNAAMTFFRDAVSVVEDEDRGVFSNEILKQITSFLLKKNQVQEAIDIMKRQCVLYEKKLETFQEYLNRNYLGLLVLYLHLGQYQKADEEMKQFMEVGSFIRSQECEAANALLTSIDNHSVEEFQKALKRQAFQFIDNEIAKLAKKLTFNEEVASSIAKVRNQEQDKKEIDFS